MGYRPIDEALAEHVRTNGLHICTEVVEDARKAILRGAEQIFAIIAMTTNIADGELTLSGVQLLGQDLPDVKGFLQHQIFVSAVKQGKESKRSATESPAAATKCRTLGKSHGRSGNSSIEDTGKRITGAEQLAWELVKDGNPLWCTVRCAVAEIGWDVARHVFLAAGLNNAVTTSPPNGPSAEVFVTTKWGVLTDYTRTSTAKAASARTTCCAIDVRDA
ncbi:unnamed protein product [Symbiodinium microadriaticum]|nr:unnamed protein product [Symbiodinium microadriaticum]